MLFKSILTLALTALPLISAASEADKHCRPCHKSSSSSSSSRRHCACTEDKARNRVKALQTEAEYYISTRQTTKFKSLTTFNFASSLIEVACGNFPNCCFSNRNADGFMGLYQPGDQTTFYWETPDYIQRLTNGTMIVTKLQSKISGADPSIVVSEELYFHWNPSYSGSCDFKLAYIDGNSLNCPNFLLDMPECALCN